MFPYPSGNTHGTCEKLLGDVIADSRAQGYNVMHPMGGMHLTLQKMLLLKMTSPKNWTYENIATIESNKHMGLSIDWSRELATCDRSYYHQQQKLFYNFIKKI